MSSPSSISKTPERPVERLATRLSAFSEWLREHPDLPPFFEATVVWERFDEEPGEPLLSIYGSLHDSRETRAAFVEAWAAALGAEAKPYSEIDGEPWCSAASVAGLVHVEVFAWNGLCA